jgi:hypothetical protein
MLLSLGKNNFFSPLFFFTAVFFHRRFFRRRLTFRAGNFFYKRAYIPKTTCPFSGGVMGNLF